MTPENRTVECLATSRLPRSYLILPQRCIDFVAKRIRVSPQLLRVFHHHFPLSKRVCSRCCVQKSVLEEDELLCVPAIKGTAECWWCDERMESGSEETSLRN